MPLPTTMADLKERLDSAGGPRITMADVYLASNEIDADPVRVPWRKACEHCALRRGDPQGLGAEGQLDLAEECREGFDFYCLHQVNSDGHHQPCASASALFLGAHQ